MSKDLMGNTSKTLFFKPVTIWNRSHDDKINFKNILTYRKAKTTFKDLCILSFKKDSTEVNYEKLHGDISNFFNGNFVR